MPNTLLFEEVAKSSAQVVFDIINPGKLRSILDFNIYAATLLEDFEEKKNHSTLVKFREMLIQPLRSLGRLAGSVRFDQLNKVNKPFQMLTGGYQTIFKNGKWGQVYGSPSKKKSFAREDRRGHQSETRAIGKLTPTSL